MPLDGSGDFTDRELAVGRVEERLDVFEALEIYTRPVARQWVEVAVADRGPGISKKDIDAFFTTKNNGIGLGVAICRSIVESHGGRLSASSNIHGGATFAFPLPPRRLKP